MMGTRQRGIAPRDETPTGGHEFQFRTPQHEEVDLSGRMLVRSRWVGTRGFKSEKIERALQSDGSLEP